MHEMVKSYEPIQIKIKKLEIVAEKKSLQEILKNLSVTGNRLES
jgi:hypothetical protein